MSRDEFRRRMLQHAEDYANNAVKFRDMHHRTAIIPFVAHLIVAAITACTDYPWCFLTAATTSLGFVSMMVSSRVGNESFQRWMTFRQEVLNELHRILKETSHTPDE